MTKSFKKCLLQNFATQTTATFCMRWPSTETVPRTAATITYNQCQPIPCPQFDRRMNPHIQMEYTNVGRIAANLLLACPFDFLKVMKVLLIDKDDSCDDYAQLPCRALVQNTAKNYNQDLPAIRENPFVIHRLSFSNVLLFSIKHIGQDGPFLLQYCLKS